MPSQLVALRAMAKQQGLRGFSRLTKSELLDALKTIVVHKGDLRVTRKLGSAYLRMCDVSRWQSNGRYPSTPRAWLVPQWRLRELGLTPLSRDEVEAASAERSEKAAETRRINEIKVANEIGALPGSRTARAYSAGHLDKDTAEYLAFRASYRHNHTNYDKQYRFGLDRDEARFWMVDDPIPDTWDEYLATYGFASETAMKLSQVLQEPKKCHPVWFKEAEIAVRNLVGELTYERIKSAIEAFRSRRFE
jgi:hypothetical protein